MIMNSWDSHITILINYFIGNEIFNKNTLLNCMYCVFFNGTNGNLITSIHWRYIKEILSFSLHHKTLAFLKKINADPKKKSVGVPFPIDRHFVFFSGWRTFFNNCALLVAKKKPPSWTHLLNVNLFHLEKEETKLIWHNSSFFLLHAWIELASLCATPRAAIRAQPRVASSFHARRRKTWVMPDEFGFFFFQVKQVHV